MILDNRCVNPYVDFLHMDLVVRYGFELRPSKLHIRHTLNNIQFISDEFSVILELYLCEKIKCISEPSTFFLLTKVFQNTIV